MAEGADLFLSMNISVPSCAVIKASQNWDGNANADNEQNKSRL
jgi:hypothetical protein